MSGKGPLARLHRCVAHHGGDVPDGFRRFARATTQEIADRLGLPRQTIEQCLRRAEGRTYPHVRRALEAEFGLPPNSLDRVI